MPHYDRFYTAAVFACLAAGTLAFAHSEPLTAAQSFVAVAIGMRLDGRLRGRWWLVDDTSGNSWERRRTPA